MRAARRRFARGDRAWGHDARTGDRVLLRDLVRDGDTGLPVTRESYEPKHPQETPPNVFDPQILRSPAPDRDRPGYTVHWPTGDFNRLWEFYTTPHLALHLTPAPAIATDIATFVAASADDANEVVSSGVTSITGTAIELQDDRFAGFRFQNLGITQGSTVDRAWIQFSSAATPEDGTSGVACTIQIWGHDTDNASVFTTGAANITSRTKTTASALWNLPASSGSRAWLENARGQNQVTPDLSSILQEIVGRAGWAFGNAAVFLFQQTTGGTGVRQVAAFDHATLQPPMLFVDVAVEADPGDGVYEDGIYETGVYV